MKITRTVELSVSEAESLLSKFDNGATYKIERPTTTPNEILYGFLAGVKQIFNEGGTSFASEKVAYIVLARRIYPNLSLWAAKHIVESPERAMEWIANGLNPNDFQKPLHR
jgi:hypothetical protein